MLKEYPTQQHKGDFKRRWFSSSYFDLIIWQNDLSEITRFQLCYDKQGQERALTWTEGRDFDHNYIDDGETTPLRNETPVLLADGLFPAMVVLDKFIADSGVIEQQIRSFIIEKLNSAQRFYAAGSSPLTT